MQAILFSPHTDEAAVLMTILQQAGLTVRSVRDFSRAIEAWPESPPDLILVAIHANNVTKVQLQQLRAHIAVPLIVITDLIPESEQVDLMEIEFKKKI